VIAGFAETLRQELGPVPINSIFVVPGNHDVEYQGKTLATLD
jgi:hypothetical protein